MYRFYSAEYGSREEECKQVLPYVHWVDFSGTQKFTINCYSPGLSGIVDHYPDLLGWEQTFLWPASGGSPQKLRWFSLAQVEYVSVALPPNSHRCRMQGSVFYLTHCPDSTVLVGAEQRLTVYLLCSVSCSAGIREGKEARRLPCSKLISCSDPISSQVEVGSQWVTDFFFFTSLSNISVSHFSGK